jgi:hypothetical protein
MQNWLPVFVLITAIAFVVQAIVMIALFFAVRKTVARIEAVTTDLHTRLAPIISRLQIIVDDSAPRISAIVNDAAELTRLARSQAQKVDRVLSEMTERLRLQLIHVDQIVTGLMETVERAGSTFRQTVVSPFVKATAFIRGIQTGVEFFSNRRKASSDAANSEQRQDEGMFI